VLKQLRAILAFAGAAEVLWLATYGLGPLRESTGLFLTVIAGQVALWAWSFFRLRITPGPGVAAVLVCGLLFRITLLPSQPHQSEDVYRYIWDARVAAAGISPYRFAPDAPELEHLRDGTVYPMLNSKGYVTAYPPLSQLLFRASLALFGESITGIKAIFCAFEFGALLLAWRLLVLWRLPQQGLLLWAWNPLFVFEFSHSGHSDSTMVFFAVLCIYLLELGRKSASVASWALAALSKLHPALWLPVLLRRTGILAALPGAALAGALLAPNIPPESQV
jgi:alpha-1,6-mannosyltransferase